MTWIIQDGQIINRRGVGLRISRPPGDVRVSRMLIVAPCCVEIEEDAGPETVTIPQLIRLLQGSLASFSSPRDRHRAAEILDEIEADPTTERIRRGLKVIYDMTVSIPESPMSRILRTLAT